MVLVRQHAEAPLKSTTLNNTGPRTANEDGESNNSGDPSANGQNTTYFVAEVRPSS